MKRPQGLILIPARYASTRFPGKPLAMIAGKSMIQHVFENASSTGMEACVVTDDERIESHVLSFGGKVKRIDDDVPSGTERIYLAYERHFSKKTFDLIINVQGDEPLLKGDLIQKLADFHASTSYDVATLVKKFPRLDESFNDPNKVKVIFSEHTKQCHYFSRASLPFLRNVGQEDLEKSYWFLHIGVYSYRPESLKAFCKAPLGHYENLEKLEQLRGLDIGLTYGALPMTDFLAGVDTPEDLKKLEGVFSGQFK